MAMRLFLIYTLVELAVVVALVSTVGFGWTVLALLGTFVVGLALAGSQVKRHIRRLRAGLNARTAHGAAADSVLVALGTVLVVVPGLASSVLGALLLLPPTRAAARPLVTAMAARRMPLVTADAASAPGFVRPRSSTGCPTPPRWPFVTAQSRGSAAMTLGANSFRTRKSPTSTAASSRPRSSTVMSTSRQPA